MKLTSQLSENVFWRIFNRNDLVCQIGYAEGVLRPGTVNINHPGGSFKLELKRGSFAGPWIALPGNVYSNTDEYVITADGKLSTIDSVATVNVMTNAEGILEYIGSTTRFFDYLDRKADTTLTVECFAKDVTGGVEFVTRARDLRTQETAGAVTQAVPTDKKISTPAVSIQGGASAKLVELVGNVLASRLGRPPRTYSGPFTGSFTFRAGAITRLTLTWQRRQAFGTVTVGTSSFRFEAVLEYLTSADQTDYRSLDLLPVGLRPAYDAQFAQHSAARYQKGWRWCSGCQGLFFGETLDARGVCPDRGVHVRTISSDYQLAYDSPASPGQHGWAWCGKCQGLFYVASASAAGKCPAGGAHERGQSSDYSLALNAADYAGQDGWKWCRNCSGLFFSAGTSFAGRCTTGGPHEVNSSGPSGAYTLKYSPAS